MTRKEIIKKARQAYIKTGITRNITEALELYLKNAPQEEQIPVKITTPELHKLKETLRLTRPECDECGAGLFMQKDAKSPDGTIYPTAWVCQQCGLIEYSDKTPAEWLEELKNADRQEEL